MWVLQTISESASDLLVGMRPRVGNERRLQPPPFQTLQGLRLHAPFSTPTGILLPALGMYGMFGLAAVLLLERCKITGAAIPGTKEKHTTGGIPRWAPTLVLVARFSAYVWQSGRSYEQR
jgi:hypothetical protein